MIICFRMITESHYTAMRQAFSETGHQVVYEPPPLLGTKKVDAEFLSLGLAERFGSYPPPDHGMAYVIRSQAHDFRTPEFIITGVTLARPVPAREEVRIIFRSIRNCVGKHNASSPDRIDLVGISEDHLLMNQLDAEDVRDIVSDELGLR